MSRRPSPPLSERQTARIESARASCRKRDSRPRLQVEGLEARQLLATFPVSSNADSGAYTLRQAIIDSNNTPGRNQITFALPAGSQTIQPTSSLPTLIVPADIDATTNPDYAGAPVVEIDGSLAGASGVNGLTIGAGAGGAPGQGSTIRGLVINRFSAAQIDVNASNGGAIIDNNYIGTDRTGSAIFTSPQTAQSNGVQLDGSAGNRVGDPAGGGKGNVISGNGLVGVFLVNGATNNTVQGNLIGTDATGNFALGNGNFGVEVGGATPGNTIGGAFAGARNVIAANRGVSGISIFPGSNNSTVQGNLIGTDITGTRTTDGNGKSFGNAVGVAFGSNSNTIGGLTQMAANVIGNSISDGFQFLATAANNVVQGNFIGTNSAGSTTLGNAGVGLAIKSGPINNTIGGTAAGAANTIDNNLGGGVSLTGGGTTGNQVQGNYIGTNASLAPGLGNFASGVLVSTGASSNTIGGAANGAGNTIAFNSSNGVTVGQSANDTTTLGNAVLSNSIFSNSGLGIDLGNNGVTPNSGTGPNSGPNAFQNTPVITSATVASGNTTIAGTLNSNPNTTFTIQLFSNPAPDPSGSGQGQTLRTTAPNPLTVTTDGSGNATFSATVAGDLTGQVVSGTATSSANDTSEFAPDVTVVQAVNLTISKAGPATVFNGTDFNYTVTVGNTGGGNATGVNITDTLPAGVTYVAATSTQNGVPVGTVSQSGGVVTDTVPALASNAPPVVLTITVHANGAGTLNNSASVRSAQTAPASVTSNTVTTTVQPAVTLAAAKSGPAAVNNGDTVTYTVTLNNTGPDTATGVNLADTLPAGLTYVSATSTQNGVPFGTVTQSNGVVTDAIPGLAANAPAVTLTINATANTQGSFNNAATVIATEHDNGPGTSNTVTTTVQPTANFVLTKAGPATVHNGDTVVYTVTLNNTGPDAGSGVNIADTVPAGLTLVSARSTAGAVTTSGNTVNDAVGALASGGPAVTLTINARANAVGTYGNAATVTATVNNSGSGTSNTATTTVLPSADLSVSKTALGSGVAGSTLTYTVTAGNNGPDNATGVVLTDTLPAGVTLAAQPTSTQGTVTVANGVVTDTVGNLASRGTPVTLTIVVNTPRSSAPLSNTAAVSGNENDPDAANNTTTIVTPLNAQTDLAVDSPTPASVPAGSPLTYTVNVTNAGPSDATGVVLTDTLPAGVTLAARPTSTQGTVTVVDGVITDTIGTLAPGSAPVTLTIRAVPRQPGAYTNTASVTGNEAESDTTNNSVTNVTQVSVAAVTNFVGIPIAAVEGQVLTNQPVARFSDNNPNATVGEFQATIDWGDNATTPGRVTQPGGPGTQFVIVGDHTYRGLGTFPVTVALTDFGGPPFTAVGSATISPSTLRATARNITAVEGAPFSGPVATFVTDSPFTVPGDFGATIDWGDQTGPAPGTITQPGGPGTPFVVSGVHQYAEESDPGTPYPLNVTVLRIATNVTTAATPGTATVSDAALALQGVPVTATAGTPLTGVPVATFTDLGGPEPVGNYAATVRFENGATTPGTVVRTGTTFTVLGSHTFTGSGTFPISVTVRHEGLNGVDTVAVSSASVAPLPLPARTNRYIIGPVVAAPAGSPMLLRLNLNGIDQRPIALTPGGVLVVNGSTANDVFTVILGNLVNPSAIGKLPFTLTVNGLGGADAFNVQSLPNIPLQSSLDPGLRVTLDGNSASSPANSGQGDTVTLPNNSSGCVTAYVDPYTSNQRGAAGAAIRLDYDLDPGLSSIALRDFSAVPAIRANLVELAGDFGNHAAYADQISVTGTGERQFDATINPSIVAAPRLRFISPSLAILGARLTDTIAVAPFAAGPWNVALKVDGGNNLRARSVHGQPLPGDQLRLIDRTTSPSQVAVNEGGTSTRNPFNYTNLDSIFVVAQVGVPVRDSLFLNDSTPGNRLDVNLGASGNPTDPIAYFHEGTPKSPGLRTAVTSTTVDNNLGVQVFNGSHVINVVLTNPPTVRRTLALTGDGTDRVQFTDQTGNSANVTYVGFNGSSGVIQVRFGSEKKATYNIPFTKVAITPTILGPNGAPNGKTVTAQGSAGVPRGPLTAGVARKPR